MSRQVRFGSHIGPAHVALVLLLSFAVVALLQFAPRLWAPAGPPAAELSAAPQVTHSAEVSMPQALQANQSEEMQAAEVPDASQTTQPDETKGAELLIKNTLLTLNQANLTNDYAVFRSLAAPGFRDANTPAALSAKFAIWRKNQADFSAIMLKPVRLVEPPKQPEDSLMTVSGYFETEPKQLSFELAYVKASNGRWQMSSINLALSPRGSGASAFSPPSPSN